MVIQKIIEKLKETYPKAECTLNYRTPLECLVAIRLSAQCTDARVNLVTPSLFSKFTTLEDFVNANPENIAQYIYSCGFYKVKSQDIVNMCKKIISDFNGQIPQNLKDLTSLPGIGRKTANLFLGEIYNIPGLVVDTHFIRVTKRLGFHSSDNAVKVEQIMAEIVPPNEMLDFCHRLVAHGRNTCTAHKPVCKNCCLLELCKSATFTSN